jgi:uncharacterized protein (DUF169 family)
MNTDLKNQFISLWHKNFNQAELPIIFYYSQTPGKTEPLKPGSTARCIIGALGEVRNGRSLSFSAGSVGCFGGRKYLGFAESIRPNFEYFLSCGIPGKMEGERYKKSPELVKEIVNSWPSFTAPAPFVTFKRWDNLEAEDEPEVVIFFAQADVLSGLFTLCNYDQSDPQGVITPMSSGCAAIVTYPYLEKSSPNPRGIIGMFDPSARPNVPQNSLTFSIPMAKFVTMINNMEESFLITESWSEVQKRIE